LSRLRDAQIGKIGKEIIKIKPHKYVKPGVLWWAFNREQAQNYHKQLGDANLIDTNIEPYSIINVSRDKERAVVLIDEIDKADLNIPNDLLEVMGMNRFKIEETGDLVERKSPELIDDQKRADKFGSILIIMTTNDERDLPPAFLRRCIVHQLEEFSDKQKQTIRWKDIARLHMKNEIAQKDPKEELVEKLAVKCWELRQENKNMMRKSPCTAEFLDALRVCYQLGIDTDSDLWGQMQENVLVKNIEQEF
jgi:MoxR-like ATPase